MTIYLLLFVLYIGCSNKEIIKNGIYNIMINNQYLFYKYRSLKISQHYNYPNTFFRIRMLKKTLNETFYNIEKISKKFKLTFLENKQLYFNKINDNLNLWSFIKIGDNEYLIKNKNNCYIKVKESNIYCDNISIYNATKFLLFRIFSETKQNITDKDIKLLDEEPIDILTKYINLRDPDLKRNGIPQTEKDYDNEELRYSIRSILMNIPWIRKIFILMPNKKVRFFKKYKYIKNKIVYVKDKDLLGYDSSNSNSFQFRYWKMKKIGLSDNIIIMDDDCFIGKKLNKNDFFYVQNGKILPLIITSNFLKIDKDTVTKYLQFYKMKVKNIKKEQTLDIFYYSKYLTILFLFNLFNFTSNEKVFIPKFTHNAIPVNLNDIKEIYNLVYNSEHKYSTLNCIYRISGFLQFQLFVLLYTFIKYDRKVKNIPSTYIEINEGNVKKYNFPLFCINKGSSNYSDLDYFKSKIAMESKFYIPSPYEIIDFSLINLSFNIISNYNLKIKNKENSLLQSSKGKNFQYYKVIFIFIFFSILYKKINKN